MNISTFIPGIESSAGDFGTVRDSEENEARILAYQKTKDPALREKIILDNLRLVLFIINRTKMKLPSTMSMEDVVSSAIIGLMGSIERYDVKKGRFTAFAYPRISGAIMDGIEDFSWFRRSDRRIFCAYLRSRADCERTLGRPPSDDEVAEEMGLYGSRRERMMTVIRNETPLSLDETLETDEELGLAAPEPELFEAEDMKILWQCVDELSLREREVIRAHFFRNLTFRQMAGEMGISTTTCLKAEKRGLEKLRAKIGDDF